MQEKIIILDFGSQYTQLIARRVRELNTYCEIVPFNKFPEDRDGIKGVILSGSPFSVNDPNALYTDLSGIRGKYPVLGVCYGAQFLAHTSGGKVESADSREYGRAQLKWHDEDDTLFKGVRNNSTVWMSHGDTITSVPDSFKLVASTDEVRVAGFKIEGEKTWGVQFHPEVYHSEDGKILLNNFVKDVCGCAQDWTPASFIESTVAMLKEKIGNDKVVLALSGGVDSTVAAVLLNKAIGRNLVCIFVDNGLLRKNEFENVLKNYEHMGLNVLGIDAKDKFYKALAGVTEPEKKRKIIGKGFIEVFDEEARKLKDIKWLAQGTIYPDVIESLSITGMVIKSHHNVGGLPQKMNLKLVEPLRLLFKDEVRRVGRELKITEDLIGRHPFPGPGLGVRILGDITPEKVRVLQEADHIFIQGLIDTGLYKEVWQAGAILLPVQSVGVMGDERTYENAVALRAVLSTDGMTADWAKLPYDFLGKVSNDIINKVRGVNRVVYDISSKPPATIEWE
ncbi:glutamine-hydrolyzing GMP synthase [Coprobacter tertius]|uniref:GMP synthase [glutamine-hydrolyzing] n=1 Tax=Coprobacter tertius TaxID=2944915 RepID=A0ABT1MGZ5_9BACT|nr:glutamine-hydrolyzing GMP synthase [Coprobacter tertius]MCP9611912.1 glutamine-hydrolyzing GMP synthase [Coprobacter tertius]